MTNTKIALITWRIGSCSTPDAPLNLQVFRLSFKIHGVVLSLPLQVSYCSVPWLYIKRNYVLNCYIIIIIDFFCEHLGESSLSKDTFCVCASWKAAKRLAAEK